MHLFADIAFCTARNLESWKTMFPNPSTSPAHYAKTLAIEPPHIVTAADTEAGEWIRVFSSVVQLEVNEDPRMSVFKSKVPLLPFHGISPVVKSLRLQRIVIPCSLVFNLILSFPLLEDVSLFARDVSINDGDDSDWPPAVVHPSGPPMLTGSLELSLSEGVGDIMLRLVFLPGGIYP